MPERRFRFPVPEGHSTVRVPPSRHAVLLGLTTTALKYIAFRQEAAERHKVAGIKRSQSPGRKRPGSSALGLHQRRQAGHRVSERRGGTGNRERLLYLSGYQERL